MDLQPRFERLLDGLLDGDLALTPALAALCRGGRYAE
jgi:hypothetical protein